MAGDTSTRPPAGMKRKSGHSFDGLASPSQLYFSQLGASRKMSPLQDLQHVAIIVW